MHKQHKGWGGRRKGAGRPVGSRNKPSLIDGLPFTDSPLVWLLALMAHEAAPMRLRVAAAKAALPYCNAMPRAGGGRAKCLRLDGQTAMSNAAC